MSERYPSCKTEARRLEDFLYHDVLGEPEQVVLSVVGVGQEPGNENESFARTVGKRLEQVVNDVSYRPMALSDQGRDDIYTGDIFDPGSYADLGANGRHLLVVPQTATLLGEGDGPVSSYEETLRRLTATPVDATIHSFVASDLALYSSDLEADILSGKLRYDADDVWWGDREPMIVARLP